MKWFERATDKVVRYINEPVESCWHSIELDSPYDVVRWLNASKFGAVVEANEVIVLPYKDKYVVIYFE